MFNGQLDHFKNIVYEGKLSLDQNIFGVESEEKRLRRWVNHEIRFEN